jgi:hypothetical protein
MVAVSRGFVVVSGTYPLVIFGGELHLPALDTHLTSAPGRRAQSPHRHATFATSTSAPNPENLVRPHRATSDKQRTPRTLPARVCLCCLCLAASTYVCARADWVAGVSASAGSGREWWDGWRAKWLHGAGCVWRSVLTMLCSDATAPAALRGSIADVSRASATMHSTSAIAELMSFQVTLADNAGGSDGDVWLLCGDGNKCLAVRCCMRVIERLRPSMAV